ncbi:MAG: hypothetical protein U1E65_32190 [Myxococcota bacterium]
MRRLLVSVAALALGCQAPAPPPTPTPTQKPAPSPSQGAPTQTTRTASRAVDTFAGGTGARATPNMLDGPALEQAMDQGRTKLGAWTQAVAGDPDLPWALAHGLVGFGADFRATDHRPAIDVIVSDFAEVITVGGKKRVHFQKRTAKNLPLEPHTTLMVKSLLEAGVPRDRLFEVKGLGKVPLSRIAEDVLADVERPKTEAEWEDFPWTLTALLTFHKDLAGVAAKPSETKRKLDGLALDTIGYLEGAQAFLLPAMDANRPDLVEKRKQGIFAHSCGGAHLIQAAMHAAIFVGTPTAKARVKKQLDILLFRYLAEKRIYQQALAQAPQAALLLHTQELKFFGHALETFGFADPLGFVDHTPEMHARLAALANDLVKTIDILAPAYHQLPAVRQEREQTYLDLIGDGCHAMRGLRLGSMALFPPR